MVERRTSSLLEFAIRSCIAVVPIMLGIVVLVAVIRPAETGPASWQGRADRYVSVRHVAALKTFEQAIVQRPATAATAPTEADVLDGLPQCRREWRAAWNAGPWLPWRDATRAPIPSQAEHIATQLAEFDAALLRFSSRANARVGHPVGLDVARWFAAARSSLVTPIEPPENPGRQFQLACADLAAALTTLSRADGRMFDALAWRGTEGSAALARWRPEQEMAISANQVARRNPWSGIAGCIYFGRHGDAGEGAGPTYFVAGAHSVQRRLCGRPEMLTTSDSASPTSTSVQTNAMAGEPGLADPVDDTRWMVPPSLHTMLQPLESLRQPTGALYRLYTDAHTDDGEPGSSRTVVSGARRAGPNRIRLDGAAVDVGFSVDLTIDPTLQALAQKTAACYTGRHDVCRALGLRRTEDQDGPIGQSLLEGAMVRMAAVAVIDVQSGRIEALAGALSPCARQEVDGPGRDAHCDRRLPYPVRYRPDALLNPAVYHDAMPASTIKPIMGAAFLSDREVGARWLAAERAAMQRHAEPAPDSLRGQLMRSDSARFLDRMFCLDKGFANCRRPWEIQSAALAFGWNIGCAEARADCGKQDLLFGRAVDATADPGANGAPATTVAYGRLMSEPLAGKLGAAMHLRPPAALDPAILRRCAAGADGRRLSDDDWEKCRGGAVVDVVAEGWGQGHARASALGIAGMMATLAAAANGQAEVHRPHLVESVRAAGGPPPSALEADVLRWGRAAVLPNPISQDVAAVILSGLSWSHRSGTARTACEQVFDARHCRDIDWLAGKTGTPSFPSDGVSLDELARQCEGGDTALGTNTALCSSLRPYKWYVAAYRADHASRGPWTKVIAVLAERNWLQSSGQVHGAGDHGPNPAAEIAMQIAGRPQGLPAGSAP